MDRKTKTGDSVIVFNVLLALHCYWCVLSSQKLIIDRSMESNLKSYIFNVSN